MKIKLFISLVLLLLSLSTKAQVTGIVTERVSTDTIEGAIISGDSIVITKFITIKDSLGVKVLILNDTNQIESFNGFISFGGNGITFSKTTTAQRAGFTFPKIGDATYDETINRLVYYNGANWIVL